MWSLLPTYTNRQGLVIETVAVASSAGQLIHVETHLGTGVVTIRLVVATFDISDNSLKRNVNIPHTAKFILIVEMKFLAIWTVKNQVFIFFW